VPDILNGEKQQAKLDELRIGNRKGRDKGETNKTTPRKSWSRIAELESIDSNGKSSYRVVKPYDDNDND
jgi:hypothetical protein